MGWKRNKKILLMLMGIFVLIWLNYNQVVNWHFHITGNGAVVVHAHPYKSNTIPDTPFQNHKHNSFEFLILSMVFYAIPILVALLVLSSLFKFRLRSYLLLPDVGTRQHGFYRTLLLRGPPLRAFQ